MGNKTIQLSDAIQLHQQGCLDQARILYEKLVHFPAHAADCYHLLGVIAHQQLRHKDAIDLIHKAIDLKPTISAFYCNLGNALNANSNYEGAIESYQRAIHLNNLDCESWFRIGEIQLLLNRIEQSIVSFSTLLQVNPLLSAAWINRAIAHKRRTDLDAALKDIDHAIGLDNHNATAFCNKGDILIEMGLYMDALEYINQAIYLNPLLAEAYSNRGNVYALLKKPQESIADFDKAIALAPHNAMTYSNKGLALMQLKRLEESILCFDTAVQIQPDYAQAFCNRSAAQIAVRRYQDALHSCQLALEIDPTMADAWSNQGNAQKAIYQYNNALTSYQNAIELKPSHIQAWCNQGVVLKEMQLLQKSLDCFDKALEIDPDYVDGHWNKALTLLLAGNYAAGWVEHEWRWKLERFSSPLRHFVQPLWLGKEDLAGKTILLHSEQGLGDTIQFYRYVEWVKELTDKIILEVHAPLVSLFKEQSNTFQIISKGDSLPHFDLHCPLMSLPLAFQSTRTYIPTQGRYLQSNSQKVENWRKKINSRRPLIGLVWQGSYQHNNDHQRSLPLSTLVRHLPEKYDYVCLQKEISSDDLSLLAHLPNIRWLGNQIENFSDTAALCEIMNLVITVDTSVAHLNAALGRPTWILLPHAPDWRWMLNRCDSPWYHSVNLFRQDEDCSWQPVLERIRKNLATL